MSLACLASSPRAASSSAVGAGSAVQNGWVGDRRATVSAKRCEPTGEPSSVEHWGVAGSRYGNSSASWARDFPLALASSAGAVPQVPLGASPNLARRQTLSRMRVAVPQAASGPIPALVRVTPHSPDHPLGSMRLNWVTACASITIVRSPLTVPRKLAATMLHLVVSSDLAHDTQSTEAEVDAERPSSACRQVRLYGSGSCPHSGSRPSL
jgi:hypothetical protein